MGKVGTIGAGVLVSLTGAVTAGGGAAAAGEGTAIFYWCNALPAAPDMIVRQSRIYRAHLPLDGFPDAGGARAAFQRDLDAAASPASGSSTALVPSTLAAKGSPTACARLKSRGSRAGR